MVDVSLFCILAASFLVVPTMPFHFFVPPCAVFKCSSRNRFSVAPESAIQLAATSTKSPDDKNDVSLATLSKAKEIISQAISVGAPAYNAGNILECSKVYQDAASDIELLLPEILKAQLSEAVRIDDTNHDAKAWGLRRAFDVIVDYELPLVPQETDGTIIFEPFGKTQLPDPPVSVMDNVMGGMSEGGWEGKSRKFYGFTSLQNNGGFASVRWKFPNVQNWSYAKGIYLKDVKHSKPQEHTFRMILKDVACEQVRIANFKIFFANPQEREGLLLIPFSEFNRMEKMGKVVGGAPAFNPLAVTEIGLMTIKPSIVGDFQLEFADWGLYS